MSAQKPAPLPSKPIELLILNSNNPGHPWTDEMVEAIQDWKKNYAPSAHLDIEYMDTKVEGYSPQYRLRLHDFLREKFEEHQFDAIITADDDALDFVRRYHQELFKDTPVIFTGVNDPDVEHKVDREYFTGVMEIADHYNTIHAVLRLLPDTNKIILIYSNSGASDYLYEQIEREFYKFPGIQFERIDSSYSMNEVEERLSRREPRTVAILSRFHNDKYGSFFTTEESTRRISYSSNIPLFTLFGNVFEYGTAGGKMIYGRQYGESAAQMTQRILEGEAPRNIPIVKDTIAEYVYDARALKRYGIPLDKLPESATVLNNPVSFWTQYGLVLMACLMVALPLGLIIAYLLSLNIRMRRAQGKFETLFNAINVSVFQVSKDGELLMINDKARELLPNAEQSPREIERWFASENIYDEEGRQLQDHERPIMRALKNGERITEELYEIKDPFDQRSRWFRTTASPMVSPATGKVEYVFSTLYEVTDHLQAELRLRRSEKMEALGKIIAGLAHDFNNALAIVRSNLEMLKIDDRPGQSRQAEVTACLEATERCEAMTRQLLMFARSKKGSVEHTGTVTLQLNSFLKELQSFLRQSLTPEIQLKLNLAPEHLHVCVEPYELENAIINLAVNARDAMGGRGTIEMSTQSQPDPETGQKMAVISVKDNGSGIQQKDLDRIFEPFFSTKGELEGTGLGLSMVYGFVKRSGGDITADSTLGKGTTFHLQLPLVKSDETAQQTRKSQSGPMRGSEKILVVDDEKTLLESTCRLLEASGYKTAKASDYEAAVKALQTEEDIALVISDILLPGECNGLDVAQFALSHRADLPVILASGQSTFYENDAPTNRFLRQLQKPVPFADLTRNIRELLDQARSKTSQNSATTFEKKAVEEI